MAANETGGNDRTIRLRDGRTLGYAEYGNPRGEPLIYCHGFPASRLEAGLIEAAASRSHVRAIAIDRPGYGLSDFKPHRLIADWPDDVVELMQALGIETFAVLGVSGGGPYALACAFKIPQQLTSVAVVCGLGPIYEASLLRTLQWPSRLGFVLARKAPWLLRLLYGDVVGRLMRGYPEVALSLLTFHAPKADRAVFRRPDIKAAFYAWVRAALTQGPRGALRDLTLYAHDWGWGFRPEDILIAVDFWHGELDTTVPPSHTRFLSRALVRKRVHWMPGEGHFSLPINRMDAVLKQLLEPQEPPSSASLAEARQ